MRPPRIQRVLSPDAADFSVVEVGKLGLLRIKRSDIYLRIKAGDIQTVRDELGHLRITAAEIARLQKLWKIDPRKLTPSPELERAARVERARIAASTNASRYTGAQIGARAIEGKRRHYADEIDPERRLPPAELERRVKRAEDAQLAKARLARIERRMLREQYGQDPA